MAHHPHEYIGDDVPVDVDGDDMYYRRLLADGDKSLGACAKAVRQMLPLCDALLQLASEQSAYGKDIAAICAKACKDCAEVCKEHADHHQECKDCLEACNDCAKSCEAFAA